MYTVDGFVLCYRTKIYIFNPNTVTWADVFCNLELWCLMCNQGAFTMLTYSHNFLAKCFDVIIIQTVYFSLEIGSSGRFLSVWELG